MGNLARAPKRAPNLLFFKLKINRRTDMWFDGEDVRDWWHRINLAWKYNSKHVYGITTQDLIIFFGAAAGILSAENSNGQPVAVVPEVNSESPPPYDIVCE